MAEKPWRVPQTKREWEGLAHEFTGAWAHRPCLGPLKTLDGEEPCAPCKARAVRRSLRERTLRLGGAWPDSLRETDPSPCLDGPTQADGGPNG